MSISYISQFLSYKCAGDVLNSVTPFREPVKEISESMAIFKKIRKVLIENPNKYTVFDICSGNCLTSSLIAHMFKIKHVFAIDKVRRERDGFFKIRNFTQLKLNIKKDETELVSLIKENSPSIIVSVHPCSELAIQTIKIYKETNADYLIMMPCCEGKLSRKYPQFLRNNLSRYDIWCLDLALLCNGNAITDKRCISPKNIVVTSTNLK